MKVELKTLFAVPLIKFRFSNHEKYKFPYIERKERIPEGWQKSLNTSFGQGENGDDFISAEKKSNLIFDISQDIKMIFLNLKMPTNFKIRHFWYNIYHDNQGQEIHDHLSGAGLKNNYWSGIYYNTNSSPTLFYRPYRQHKVSMVPEYHNPDCYMYDYYQDTYFPQVSDGDIILFPPWIEHSVDTDETFKNKMRLTFAFNLSYEFTN